MLGSLSQPLIHLGLIGQLACRNGLTPPIPKTDKATRQFIKGTLDPRRCWAPYPCIMSSNNIVVCMLSSPMGSFRLPHALVCPTIPKSLSLASVNSNHFYPRVSKNYQCVVFLIIAPCSSRLPKKYATYSFQKPSHSLRFEEIQPRMWYAMCAWCTKALHSFIVPLNALRSCCYFNPSRSFEP